MVLPSVISRRSRLPSVIAIFQLPTGADTLDGSVTLYPGGVESRLQRVICDTKKTTVFVWFDKEQLVQAIPRNGLTDVTLVARQPDGPYLYGKSRVLIIK